MTLIELIKNNTNYAGLVEALNGIDLKTADASFYQPDEAGNTAFHHLVLAVSNQRFSEKDAVSVMFHLVGKGLVLENKKIDINALNGDNMSAMQLASQQRHSNFAHAMMLLNRAKTDTETAKKHFKTEYAPINKLASQFTLERSPVLLFTPGRLSSSSDERPSNQPSFK